MEIVAQPFQKAKFLKIIKKTTSLKTILKRLFFSCNLRLWNLEA